MLTYADVDLAARPPQARQRDTPNRDIPPRPHTAIPRQHSPALTSAAQRPASQRSPGYPEGGGGVSRSGGGGRVSREPLASTQTRRDVDELAAGVRRMQEEVRLY